MLVLAWFSLLLSLVVLVPVLVVSLECLTAFLRGKGTTRFSDPTRTVPRLVVLVPAQNEEELLPGALASIATELTPADRVLVVAHNCTDGTVAAARRAGVGVLEVDDDGTAGKPAALLAGVEALDADPPEVVVVIDADCRVSPGSIAILARMAHRHGGPVQGTYLFAPPAAEDGHSLSSLSSLALLVKNLIRPLGLRRLGLPCLLNGSGSAFPFLVLRRAPQGEGSIAEDYQLSVDLALRGYPTYFCPQAETLSVLPGQREAARKQRRRWEHGHLRLTFETAPRLFMRGMRERSVGKVALAFELAVPPLSFLVLVLVVSTFLAGLVALSGASSLALGLNLCGAALLVTALLLACFRFAGPARTIRAVTRLPRYVLSKVPLYWSYWSGGRETRWRKTPRDDVKPPAST